MSYLRRFEYKMIPTESFQLVFACGGCGKKQRFINTKRFRVNANGNKQDIWLIYQCEKCKHTLNIPIYERIDKNKVIPEEYAGFCENDIVLAEKYGRDISLFKRNQYKIDFTNTSFQILNLENHEINTAQVEYQTGDTIIITDLHNIKICPEKIAGMILHMTRSAIKKMIENQKIVVEKKENNLEIHICSDIKEK